MGRYSSPTVFAPGKKSVSLPAEINKSLQALATVDLRRVVFGLVESLGELAMLVLALDYPQCRFRETLTTFSSLS